MYVLANLLIKNFPRCWAHKARAPLEIYWRYLGEACPLVRNHCHIRTKHVSPESLAVTLQWAVVVRLNQVLQLEAKVDEGRVLTEYDSIPRIRTDPFEVASFLSRDRVKEVTPYRDNRVEIPPSEENPLGYVNASHIEVSWCFLLMLREGIFC